MEKCGIIKVSLYGETKAKRGNLYGKEKNEIVEKDFNYSFCYLPSISRNDYS